MKTIVLLAAAVIAGAIRYPVEGPINVRDEAEADRLIENGLAEDPEDDGDDLDDKTITALKDLAKEEKIDLGEVTRKPDIIAAIRKARETKEG